MKKLFTALLLLIGLSAFSQSKGYFRYDSTVLEKVGGNNELILLNSTRNVTGGVLTNIGNGRTSFVTPSGGGSPNTSIGTKFKIAVNATNNVKSLNFKYGTIGDSATTGEVGITVDTTTAIQPKNLLYPSSVEKSGVTVRLQNDVNTDSTVYANLGGKGWGNAAVIDKSGGTPGQAVVWLGGRLFGLETITGGSASQPYQIKFRPGLTPNAPANAATYIVCDSLTGKGVKFFRDGDLQFEGTGTGEYRISNDTLYVGTPFYTSERDLLEIWENPFDSAAICPPGTAWVDLTFSTNTNLVNTTTVWTATGQMNWSQFGLDALTLTADGSIAMQYSATDGHECILGFDAANTSKDYTTYDYGVFLDDGGLLYRIVNGTPTSLGVSISVGDWVRINRTGSTFKIQSSSDKSTWTDRYTFAATSSATHYVNLCIYDSAGVHGKCYHPQGFGLNFIWPLVFIQLYRRKRRQAA